MESNSSSGLYQTGEKHRVTIIIPFYENPHLAENLLRNIISLPKHPEKIELSLVVINDSPWDEKLGSYLKEWVAQTHEGFTAKLISNPENLGFVGSVNKGLKMAHDSKSHAIILNSDTQIHGDAILQMLLVLEADPMVGFVSPRTNNATLCSLPAIDPGGPPSTRSFEGALREFEFISAYLPAWQFAPTAVGFCLLIRDLILAEFGLLDPIYGKGYNEENDLICRANRAGYSPALANRAFVFHEGSVSFGSEVRSDLHEKNAKILDSRYPEFIESVGGYFGSPTFRFERLISRVCARRGDNLDRQTLAVDCTSIALAHNGTYHAAAQIIRSLSEQIKHFDLYAVCSEQVARYHGIDKFLPPDRIVCSDDGYGFDAIIKIGQPFSFDEFIAATRRAVHVYYMMLDTIAWDCLYLRKEELDGCWDLVSEYADGLLFISEYARQGFNRRFPKALSKPQLTCRLSLDQTDYLVHQNLSPAVQEKEASQYLVIGNHYVHKYLEPTIARLNAALPQIKMTALGMRESHRQNIRAIPSGQLKQIEMEELYANAKAVIIPSMYEGFGFPMMEGLARGKVVFIRDNGLTRELAGLWKGGGTLVFYKDTDELIEELAHFEHKGTVASESHLKFVPAEGPHDLWNWKAIGQEIERFVWKVSREDPLAKSASKRLNQLGLMQAFARIEDQKVRMQLAPLQQAAENQIRALLEQKRQVDLQFHRLPYRVITFFLKRLDQLIIKTKARFRGLLSGGGSAKSETMVLARNGN